MSIDFGLRAEFEVVPVTAESLRSDGVEPQAYDFNGRCAYDADGGTHFYVKNSDSSKWALSVQGDIESSLAEGVHACPSPNHFLVVVDSIGFYVDSRYPGLVTRVHDEPIRKIERILNAELLLLVGFTSLTAIGPPGILWTSDRLVTDGLTIKSVSSQTIFGHGDVVIGGPDGEALEYFSVSIKDGSLL